jgi:hypothetical protein
MIKPSLLAAILAPMLALSAYAQDAQPAEEGQPNPPKRIAWVGDEKSVELEVFAAKTGHLFVKPTINGQDGGWWFLDTGAGINCIDKKLAEQLKLPVLREGKASGMGGEADTRYFSIDTLSLGPALLEGSEAIELDLSALGGLLGTKVNGIIGYDTFFAGVFEIDHRAGKAWIHDPKSYELKDAQWIDIKILDRRPSVEGQIEGHPAGALLIDSGSNTGAIVTTPTVKQFDLLNGRDVSTKLQGGVGGMRRQKSGSLKDITIGKIHLKGADTIFSESETGGTATDKYQAILGIPVLKQFVMVVNYPEMKMALKLNTDSATTKAVEKK